MADTSGRWRLGLAATGVGLLVALSFGELLLRWMRPPELSRLRYPCIYRPDPHTGYAYVPGARGVHAGHFEFENEVEINSLGFHDAEPEPDGRARPRILAVGDSFTAALALPPDQIWTSVLERELRREGLPAADVVNLGLDGSGTGAHAALLERFVPRFEPDVVLLAFYANDVEDVLRPQLQRECHRGYVLAYPSDPHRDALRAVVDAHRDAGVRRFLHDRSYLVRLVVAAALPPMNPYRIEFLQPRLAAIEPKENPSVGRRRWAEAVARLEAVAGSCDCRFVVVPVPPRSDARGSADVWARRGSERLAVYDAAPAIAAERERVGWRHEDLYFLRDSHFNARGNEAFGRALARWLLRTSGGRSGVDAVQRANQGPREGLPAARSR